MLKTVTPTLQIKTTGIDLSSVEMLYVTIKQGQGDFQIIKSNEHIEIDNDIISVSLAQSEMMRLEENDGINIQIIALGNDGEVSNVKIAWVKRGSRTSHIPSEESGSGETSISNEVWYPTVSTSGDITWEKSTAATPPTPRNIKGDKGNDGITPHIDISSGNWFVGTVNTGVKARGEDGNPGENGASPTIGDNGNWYIGSNDTGVKAKGTDGRDGKDGVTPIIKVGTVSTGDPGTQAKVNARTDDYETENVVIFDFVIPRGEKGDPGSSEGSGGGSSATDLVILSKLDEILDRLGGFSFGYTEDGKPGFKEPDGSKFIAFNSESMEEEMYKIATNIQLYMQPLDSNVVVVEKDIEPIIEEGIQKITINSEIL